MFIHEDKTIISVKEMLEHRYRVPPVRQVLLWEGHVLGDGKYEGEKTTLSFALLYPAHPDSQMKTSHLTLEKSSNSTSSQSRIPVASELEPVVASSNTLSAMRARTGASGT